MPKRCFRNPLKISKNKAKPKKKVLGERMRKSRAPAGFVPKPLRNYSLKNAETLLLEPTKNKQKQGKTLPKTQEKGAWGAHAKKQSPSRFCAQAIAKLQPEKCRNVALGTH